MRRASSCAPWDDRLLIVALKDLVAVAVVVKEECGGGGLEGWNN